MGTVAELSWADVAAWRARRQRLDERVPAAEMLGVTGELCGAHAQVMSSAELTLHARVDGLDPGDVATALWDDRTLVKTWAMRGTLHLLRADEYALWQAALSPQYERFTKPAWSRAAGMTPDELERLIEAMADALDGDPLTREELADTVARRSKAPALGEKLRGSWGSLLKPAAVRGVLCFAPGDGQKVRFTRPDRWLGAQAALDPADAEVEVARRFLRTHGPATRDTFGRWWGIQPAPAGRILKRLGDEAAEVTVDGMAMTMLADDAAEAARGISAVSTVRLLPGFDQYVIAATRHADRLLPDPALRPLVYRDQGWISAVMVVDGRIEGVWRYERKGSRLRIELEPFGGDPKPKLRRAVEAEAERVAAWLGGALELVWLTPSTGR
jgi:hypothetical protein